MLDNSLVVSCDFTKKDICKLAEKIINIDPNDINLEQQLEYLFVELIRNKKIPLSKNINWELVCEKCAIIYTRNLNKKKQRSLRTKAIRNNFLIREMIDKYKETNRNKTHSEEIGLFVWDFKTYLDKKILITSDKKINEINFQFKDLSSRLKTFNSFEIFQPNDDMLLTILTKLLIDKQFVIKSNDIFEYIIRRVERTYNGIHEIVNKLDILSLEKKRQLTIPLIKEIL